MFPQQATLVNATIPAPGNKATLPVALMIDDEGFMAALSLPDSAQAGKSGTAQ